MPALRTEKRQIESKTKSELIRHLGHVNYPIKGKQFFEACNDMSHIPEEEKAWILENLPEGRIYSSPEDIKQVLGL